jgi:hypothetical protein
MLKLTTKSYLADQAMHARQQHYTRLGVIPEHIYTSFLQRTLGTHMDVRSTAHTTDLQGAQVQAQLLL